MEDYLIIPIQRVARYGLLLAGNKIQRQVKLNSSSFSQIS